MVALSSAIAVIGAGPSGLCVGRHLLRCGLRPQIFERSTRVGGLWNTASARTWDSMTPNLSRFTCRFSDFPWPDGTPAFPTREQMQTYFEDYSAKFLERDLFRFECTVTKVERASDGKFTVEWVDSEKHLQTKRFDGVVVATGFFSDPVWPDADMSSFPGRHIHSSQYRSPEPFENKTVAVCGASFSALEIAADVAKRAAKVVSILPRVPWVVPRYIPLECSPSAPFAPVDIVFYQRDQQAPKPEQLFADEESNKKKHAFLRKLLGPRKQAAIGFPSDDSSPPFVSISDNYLDLVTDGKIEVVKGKLVGCDGTNLAVSSGEAIPGIDDLISCTGYCTRLQFLQQDILEVLKFDGRDQFSPFILCYDSFHPDLPGLGFVGMYRGPYLGAMELQARLVAGIFSDQMRISDDKVTGSLNVSKKIRHQKPRPQFPHGDYVGLMDSLSKELNLVPEGKKGAKGMMVTPAAYQPCDDLADKAMDDIEKELEECKKGKNIAKAVLRALVGHWEFKRTITHFSVGSSNGWEQKVAGRVTFSRQSPNLDKLLYREDGILSTSTGDFEVFQEYEYSHNAETGALEIHFLENGARANLFLSLPFHKMEDSWEAESDHLCVCDLYKGTFRVSFDGLAACSVQMKYRVNGPKKNYEAVTNLQPI